MSVANRWLVWLIGISVVGSLIYLLSPILSPFLVGMLLAYLGDPLVDRLEAWRFSRTWGVVTVFALLGLVLLLMLLVLIPMLSRQVIRLYQLTPQALDWLQGVVFPWLQAHLGLGEDFWRLGQVKAALKEQLGSTDLLTVVVSQATTSGLALVVWVGNVLLVPVVGFYLMRDWDLIVARLRELLPRRGEAQVVSLFRECHEVLGAFWRGQLLVMLALAIIYAAGLMSIGLELGLLIGILAGLASLVPYMGFVVGIGAALVAAMVQFGLDAYALVGVLAVFSVGQLLEGFLLTPMLVGDRIGLHPVAVIFAILAGGQLFGFVGVLLALPVAAVVMVLLRHVHDLYKLSHLYDDDSARVANKPSGYP